MRTPLAHAPNRHRGRAFGAAVAAAFVLVACSGDEGNDETVTSADPVEDVEVDPGGPTDAKPLPDVPGVTGAEPSDDIVTDGDATTSADAADDIATGQAAEAQVPPLLDVVDGWPETTVTLDGESEVIAKVAAQPDRRQQGLMNVEDLPDGVGMLFLFDEPSEGGFWMKNTLVPLDIAYILEGEVVSVLQMDPCEDDPCPSYEPGGPYDAALEVNQGALADAGVTEGSSVTWRDPVEVTSA